MYSYFLEFLSVLSLNQLNKAVIDAGLAEKVLLLSARKTRRPCPAGVPVVAHRGDLFPQLDCGIAITHTFVARRAVKLCSRFLTMQAVRGG